MKYKYIGTEEQLIEHGFEMEHTGSLVHGIKVIDESHALYVVLEISWDYPIRLILWDFDDCNDDITPYIQDLIDANLVEVIV
jgi:hypothetical protein